MRVLAPRSFSLCTTTDAPGLMPSSTCTWPSRLVWPRRTGANFRAPLSIVHTPVCACTRLTAALGSSTAWAVVGSDKVTSASSPIDRLAGAWSRLTWATRSSVTLSLTASTRATLPANACPGFDRSTTCAGRPAASPAERPWSRRTLIHRDDGSKTRSTAWPATTVDPGSASRLVTTPSAGASRRTFARCWRSPARSAASRCWSCRAAARLASAALTMASADACSCRRASTAPVLMKF